MSHQVIIGDPNTLHLQKLSARENTMERARGCPQHSATPLVQLCKHARSRLANKHAIKVCRVYNRSAKSKVLHGKPPDTLNYAAKPTHHLRPAASLGHPAVSPARPFTPRLFAHLCTHHARRMNRRMHAGSCSDPAKKQRSHRVRLFPWRTMNHSNSRICARKKNNTTRPHNSRAAVL